MKRDDFAAGHRWKNKVQGINVDIKYEESLDDEKTRELESQGYTTMLMEVTITDYPPPKFI